MASLIATILYSEQAELMAYCKPIIITIRDSTLTACCTGYLVHGTHDTGSKMYPLDSDTWQGSDCLKCITGENGITIIDLHFNNLNSKHFVGWFVNMENQILDQFESSAG